jgi:hypothetical protein
VQKAHRDLLKGRFATATVDLGCGLSKIGALYKKCSIITAGGIFQCGHRFTVFPQPCKIMKYQQPSIIIGAAIVLLFCFPWLSGVLADSLPVGAAMAPVANSNGYPLFHECVVTVDPLAVSKTVTAGDSNIVTGFDAPDTVRGKLIRLDAEWLVLRDGCNENWIARNKVLMIHICN